MLLKFFAVVKKMRHQMKLGRIFDLKGVVLAGSNYKQIL